MPRYIALLRAINVGGHVVTMADLKKPFVKLGFEEVETFIASGNVIFSSPSRSPDALEKKIEAALEKALGYEVSTFLRTDAEIAEIAQRRPFAAAHMKDATTFCVGFLAGPLDTVGHKALKGFANDLDRFHHHGREVYWLSRARQSESKFTNALMEKALKLRSTFRNMNTVERLARRYPPT